MRVFAVLNQATVDDSSQGASSCRPLGRDPFHLYQSEKRGKGGRIEERTGEGRGGKAKSCPPMPWVGCRVTSKRSNLPITKLQRREEEGERDPEGGEGEGEGEGRKGETVTLIYIPSLSTYLSSVNLATRYICA